MLNPPNIGLISSIDYNNTNLRSNFRKGVDNVGQVAWADAVAPLQNQGYDIDGALKTVIEGPLLNNNGNVGLIVTVGGLATATAARKYATKPFLSLVGGTTNDFPGTIANHLCGGVSLGSYSQNDARFNYLTGVTAGSPHHFSPDKVCLLVDPRSAMTNTEVQQWPTPPRGRTYSATTLAEIANAFSDMHNDGMLAAVVSAAPFFQQNKDTLIPAANSSNIHACYPLRIYANNDQLGKPTPNPHKHTLYGPRLAPAYFRLGQLAATVITNNGTPLAGLEPMNQEIQDDDDPHHTN